MNDESNASSVNAERGIFVNPSPLPLKYPLPDIIFTCPNTLTEPVNCEPLSIDSTLNPKFGDTDAVTDPLWIRVAAITSSANADNGIFVKPAPLPVKNEPILACMFPFAIISSLDTIPLFAIILP